MQVDPTAVGRALAAQRRPKTYLCRHCQAPYKSVGRPGFCGPPCRHAAYRARKRRLKGVDR